MCMEYFGDVDIMLIVVSSTHNATHYGFPKKGT